MPSDDRTNRTARQRGQQGMVLEGILLVAAWVGLLTGGLWLLHERLVPSLEGSLADDVSAAITPVASHRIDVRQQGRVTTLAGKVASASERRRVLSAAQGVPWISDVVDRLEPVADVRLLETDLGLLPRPPRPRALAPERARDGEPRTRVFGAILPPWRAPAVFRPPEPRAEMAAEVESVDAVEYTRTVAMTASDGGERHDARVAAAPRPDAVILAARRDDTASPPGTRAIGGAASSPVRADPAVDPVLELQQAFDALGDTRISFQSGSDVLESGSLAALDRIATVVRSHGGVVVSIGGHTDASGDERKNLVLSQARSNAVRDYLVARGVSPYRLLAQGFGETRPIADNDTVEGKAANRRIEFAFGDTGAL